MKDSSNNHKLFRSNQSGGFIEIIVVIIIALILLHVMGIDLTSILQKQSVIDFAVYVRDMLQLVWNDLVQIFNFVKGLPAQTSPQS